MKLLWLSACLIVPVAAVVTLGVVHLPGRSSVTVVDVLTWLLSFGLLALISVKLANRRGWARWLLGIIVALGLISAAFSIAVLPEIWRSASPLFYLSSLLQTVIQLTALILVFSRSSREWFANGRAAV